MASSLAILQGHLGFEAALAEQISPSGDLLPFPSAVRAEVRQPLGVKYPSLRYEYSEVIVGALPPGVSVKVTWAPFEANEVAASQENALITVTLAKYGGACEAAFEELAAMSPEALVRLIRSGRLSDAQTSFAAEALGEAQKSRLVRDALLTLVSHRSPLVREGAIYGLANYLPDLFVRVHLGRLLRTDPSPGIAVALRSVLESG